MDGPKEYKVDFALYAGTYEKPIRIALNCDNTAYLDQRNFDAERGKEINLQSGGWLCTHISPLEVNLELQRFISDENYTPILWRGISNTIDEKVKLIDSYRFADPDFRSILTGFKWGHIVCPDCGANQLGVLNYKQATCRECNTIFMREIKPSEDVKYDIDGMLYFNE